MKQTQSTTNTQSIHVQFRHMPPSNSIKELVKQQADQLHHFNLTGSRFEVVIDEMHHRHKGNIFKVTIRLTLPGKRVFAAHAEEKSGSHEYLYGAVRMAFDEIERQLEKKEKRSRRREARALAA